MVLGRLWLETAAEDEHLRTGQLGCPRLAPPRSGRGRNRGGRTTPRAVFSLRTARAAHRASAVGGLAGHADSVVVAGGPDGRSTVSSALAASLPLHGSRLPGSDPD